MPLCLSLQLEVFTMLIKEPLFVLIDGRRMAYVEVSPPHPQGTVLLLTGAGARKYSWYKQLDVFGRVFRTIALDYRDTGDSDPFPQSYTIADVADDAALVLNALDVQRAHVVGISMGGFVGLQMALRHPERVEKLVLVDTSSTYIAISSALVAQTSQIQQDPDLEPGERIVRVMGLVTAPNYFSSHPEDRALAIELARYRPMTPESSMRQMQACLSYDVSEQLDRIHTPTLVIHGELDPSIPAEHGHFLAEHIKGARFLLYQGVGHLPIFECPEDFNRDVLAFLESEKES
jgi:3-oxoadipate enol-lactonase